MRLAIDAPCWANDPGCDRYAREIIPAMAAASPEDEFPCLLDSRSLEPCEFQALNVRRIPVPNGRSPLETRKVARRVRGPALGDAQ